MGFNNDFFKDYGFGNFYQGTAKNTSGQSYDPASYGGRTAYNPSQPNNTNSINPNSWQPRQSSLGSLFNPGLSTASALPFTGNLSDFYSNRWNTSINRGGAQEPSIYDEEFWKLFMNQYGWI